MKTTASECGCRHFLLLLHVFLTFKVIPRKWTVNLWVHFVATVSIASWFFLIPRFLSVNDKLEFIVCYNFWPQQMCLWLFLFCMFTRVYFVCLYVCVSFRIHVCVYTFGFSFITLLNNLRLLVWHKIPPTSSSLTDSLCVCRTDNPEIWNTYSPLLLKGNTQRMESQKRRVSHKWILCYFVSYAIFSIVFLKILILFFYNHLYAHTYMVTGINTNNLLTIVWF